jgi:hypothetical protein
MLLQARDECGVVEVILLVMSVIVCSRIIVSILLVCLYTLRSGLFVLVSPRLFRLFAPDYARINPAWFDSKLRRQQQQFFEHANRATLLAD